MLKRKRSDTMFQLSIPFVLPRLKSVLMFHHSNLDNRYYKQSQNKKENNAVFFIIKGIV